MRVLLLNPPHPAVSSRCHDGRMPPLGLLAVGGPLLDAGYDVRLIDAEFGPMSAEEIARVASSWEPDAVFLGHSGSTSAHPTVLRIARTLKSAMPDVWTVYGGVYPTYHAREILDSQRDIDVLVCGEGEATSLRLIATIQAGQSLALVPGIAYRESGVTRINPPAALLGDLDSHRVGWELIEDWDQYQYWGAGRAAVVQFSRGCPHVCTYCGQRSFWSRWRHRQPTRVAAEIAWLHRTHGVCFVDLADENPTSSPRLWREFLEALIAEHVPVQLVATIRADDIVRDAEILPLYKRAGFARILLGIETTNRDTRAKIRKSATEATDREAIRLLRKHGILSQVAYVVGFEQDADRELYRGLRQLLSYDPDLINAMYVTPHRWTPFYRDAADRKVVETDPSRWDYRHQVLAAGIPPWRLFWWVKLTELILQLRPRALRRVLAHRDRKVRRALRWCYGVARRAWLFEVREFLGRQARRPDGLTLHEFWGAPLNHEPTNAAAFDAEPARPTQSPTLCPAVRNTVIG